MLEYLSQWFEHNFEDLSPGYSYSFFFRLNIIETFEHEFVLLLEKKPPANWNTLSNKYCVLIG